MITDLNELQLQAVTHTAGPLSIIAGPGTGKTKTLTTRIAYLIKEQNIAPESILALTFTKKAAQEMRERVQSFLETTTENKLSGLTISTFHALGYELLKQENTDLSIINEQQQTKLLEQLLSKMPNEEKLSVKEAKTIISQIKNNILLSYEPYTNLIQKYNENLEQNNLLDYDDLIKKTVEKLQCNIEFKEKINNKFKYVLIDEFQDTNNVQYELIKLLVNKEQNLMVIGDPLQSIYAFRGSDSSIFTKFTEDFTNAQTLVLKQNYRSSEAIIKASHSLFPNSVLLSTAQPTSAPVKIIQTPNEISEAELIVEDINTHLGGTDLLKSGKIHEYTEVTKFSDYAIIYRTHKLRKKIEAALNKCGIPFQIIGDSTIYESERIAPIIQIMNYLNQASQKTWDEIKLTNKNAIKAHIDSIHKQDSLHNIVERIQQLTQNELILTEEQTIEFQQFISVIIQFESNVTPLHACLEYLNYLNAHEFYDPQADKITLLTIHASKGLEFKNVFIIGFEEGYIPLIRKFGQKNISIETLNEERRLLYVAMTRAKQKLTLIHTKTRNHEKTTISQFANQLDKDSITQNIDKNTSKIESIIKKQKEKKSQLRLF